MLRRIRRHVANNVVGYLALTVAVAGVPTAWALAKNSVGTKQIKPNAVRSSDVKDDALKGVDVNEGTLGQVPSAQSARNSQQAENANSLDGLDSTDFLRSNGKAADADNLDGSDASAFQRRVTGTCGQGRGISAVTPDGSVDCSARVVLPIALTPGDGFQNSQLVFFDNADLQIVARCRPTIVSFANFSGAAATLNWMFTEGTNPAPTVNASGNVIGNSSALDFSYGNSGRLEGQWIFSTQAGVTTVNLHAFQGANSCEVRGTALWAPL